MTHNAEIAELFESGVHALLHDEQLLLLVLDVPSEIPVLLVDLTQKIVDLHLLGLVFSLNLLGSPTRSESSSSVSCRLYLAITDETSELLFLDESSARSLANDKSLLMRSSSSLWLYAVSRVSYRHQVNSQTSNGQART